MNKVLKKTSLLIVTLFMIITQVQLPVFAEDSVTTNLALNKTVTYSGVEGDKTGGGAWTYPQFVGEGVVDGDVNTRWSANKIDEAWLTVDLGDIYALDQITINFHAETTDYDLLVSNDGENWETISAVTDGTSGSMVVRTFDVEGAGARYVKYQQKKQWVHTGNGKSYSSSIIELEVSEQVTTSANLALNKTVTYSGVEGDKTSGGAWTYPQFVGEGVVDGDVNTRWSANKIDEAWLMVDLGDIYTFDQITINFHAETTDYDLLVSSDGENWETASSVIDGTSGTMVVRTFNVEGTSARYVKYQQKKQWVHTGNGKSYSSSIIELEVSEQVITSDNLALNKSVTYSGVEGDKTGGGAWTYPQFVGENVTDGNMTSRWSGNKVDDAWLTVDLGEIKEISEVLIYFEAAAPKYQVLVSKDGVTWINVYEETDGEHGAKGMVQVSFDMIDARYVKYQQLERWQHSSNNNLYSTSFYEIEVYKEILIENITLLSTSDVLSLGDTYQLEPIIAPNTAVHKEITYVSGNSDIATVDENGLVTGVGVGATTITIKSAEDDTIFATFDLEVVDGEITVSKFILEQTEMKLTPRDKRFINYEVYPSKAIDANLDVVWQSDDADVATINEKGLLKVVGVGSTIITIASKENPAIKASFTLEVVVPTYNEDYDTMQDRWLRRVVGDETLDLTDTDIADYVANISSEGESLWESMDKSEDRTYLWAMSDSTLAADYTTQFTKINKLALSFGTKGSTLYQNKELYNDILSAIDFMVVNKKYNGTYYSGNWWDWQIGCTHQLVDTLIILKDYSEDTDIEAAITSVEGYASDPAKQMPSATATGANRTDIGLAVLGSAIVARDDARMNLVLTKVPDVMKLVTSGDGLYADGSVVQHTAHAYTGSYGNELMKGIGKIQSITTGTAWEITDERIVNVYNTAVNGYIPLMESGRMMNMVNGRSISRAPGTNPFTTELASGSETISNLMLISQFAPEEYAAQIQSAIKYWLNSSKDEYNFFAEARDIESLLNAKGILNDEAITEERYTGMRVYGSMDRVVQSTDTYAVGLSMYSSRIYNYEYGNTENAKGWHTADGALYLYTDDYKQYNEGYWTTIDPLRIAGTTTDTRTLNKGSDQSEKSPQSLVGGVSDGTNGTASMFLNKSHVANMNLQAKKSWFFLGDRVIAVGSGITGTSTNTIETTIENRAISDDAIVSINGETWTEDAETLALQENEYIHFTEASSNTSIGYYFPNTQDVNGLVEERTGKYSDINTYFVNDKTYTADYFSLGINHGSTVTNGSYEYVLFPNSTEEQIADYATSNDLEIINNGDDVHAIKEGNVFAMNTFKDNVELEGFKIDKPACIYTVTEDGLMTISISNPKQNAVTLELELTDGYRSVVSKDDKVTVNGDGSFTVDTTGAAGRTFTIVVELDLDTEALEALIADVAELEETDYTPASWSALQTTLTNANALLADTSTVTQLQVDEMVVTLQVAIDALVEVADKTALVTLVETAEGIDTTLYTSASQVALQEALLEANAILEDANATQEEVDAVVVELQVAMDALVEFVDTVLTSEDGNIIVSGSMHEGVELVVNKYADINDIVSRIQDTDFLSVYDMLEAYDIYLMRNGEIYIPTYPIEIKIKTTALDDKKYALVYIDEDGSVEYVASAYDGEYVTFEIEHLSDFGIATKKVSNGNVTPNTDVGEDTTGTGDTTNIAGLASIGIFAIIGFIVFYRRKGSL